MRSPDNQDLLCANIPWLREAVAAVNCCRGGRSVPIPGEGFRAADTGSLPQAHHFHLHFTHGMRPCPSSRTALSPQGWFLDSAQPKISHQPHQQSSPGGTGGAPGQHRQQRVSWRRSTLETRQLWAPPLSLPVELYLIEGKKWRQGTSKHQTYRFCK